MPFAWQDDVRNRGIFAGRVRKLDDGGRRLFSLFQNFPAASLMLNCSTEALN